MELRSFGSGHRRPLAAPGSHAVEELEIHRDSRGLVAELAFARSARVVVPAAPRTTILIVIEGGGLVEVGGERDEHGECGEEVEPPQRFRIANGQSIYLEAGTAYRVVTEQSEMRAIVVELAGEAEPPPGLIEGAPAPPSDEPPSGGHASGSVHLIPRGPARPPHLSSGEPW
jgi:hypothetical protein